MIEVQYYVNKEDSGFKLLYRGKQSDLNFTSVKTLEEYKPFQVEVDGETKELKVFEYGFPIKANPNEKPTTVYKVTSAK